MPENDYITHNKTKYKYIKKLGNSRLKIFDLYENEAGEKILLVKLANMEIRDNLDNNLDNNYYKSLFKNEVDIYNTLYPSCKACMLPTQDAIIIPFFKGLDFNAAWEKHPELRLDIIIKIIQAINNMHDKNLVHGDIKYDNLTVNISKNKNKYEVKNVFLFDFDNSAEINSPVNNGTQDFINRHILELYKIHKSLRQIEYFITPDLLNYNEDEDYIGSSGDISDLDENSTKQMIRELVEHQLPPNISTDNTKEILEIMQYDAIKKMFFQNNSDIQLEDVIAILKIQDPVRFKIFTEDCLELKPCNISFEADNPFNEHWPPELKTPATIDYRDKFIANKLHKESDVFSFGYMLKEAIKTENPFLESSNKYYTTPIFQIIKKFILLSQEQNIKIRPNLKKIHHDLINQPKIINWSISSNDDIKKAISKDIATAFTKSIFKNALTNNLEISYNLNSPKTCLISLDEITYGKEIYIQDNTKQTYDILALDEYIDGSIKKNLLPLDPNNNKSVIKIIRNKDKEIIGIIDKKLGIQFIDDINRPVVKSNAAINIQKIIRRKYNMINYSKAMVYIINLQKHIRGLNQRIIFKKIRLAKNIQKYARGKQARLNLYYEFMALLSLVEKVLSCYERVSKITYGTENDTYDKNGFVISKQDKLNKIMSEFNANLIHKINYHRQYNKLSQNNKEIIITIGVIKAYSDIQLITGEDRILTFATKAIRILNNYNKVQDDIPKQLRNMMAEHHRKRKFPFFQFRKRTNAAERFLNDTLSL